MCMPPADSAKDPAANKKRLDSLRNLRCPRLMSSAAEYYRNRDWKQTVKIYKEITTLDCDEWNPVYAPPQEIYQYYAIAYEQMGKFDSADEAGDIRRTTPSSERRAMKKGQQSSLPLFLRHQWFHRVCNFSRVKKLVGATARNHCPKALH